MLNPSSSIIIVFFFLLQVKAGHLASQQEDEFVKQIKNVLSSTSAKKFTSAESATTTAGAAPTATKDVNKATPVHEQVEVKVGAPLEATKPSQNPVDATSSASNGTVSTSAPTLSTATPATVGNGLPLSVSAGVQQSLSRPSSQPSSPPSDSIKISFADTMPSTKVVPSSVATVGEHAQESQSESGMSTLVPTTTTSKQTYSQVVMNGAATKAGAVPISTAPIFTQTNVLAGATCSIAPTVGTLPTCPVTTAPMMTTTSSDLASLSSSSVTESSQVTQPAKKRKVFEVENVNETENAVNETDSPSPDPSEQLSAHSSTENLSVEGNVTTQAHSVATTEGEGQKNIVAGLESKSDSYISVRQLQQQRGMGSNASMGGIAEFSGSNTPEPPTVPVVAPSSTNAVAVVCHPQGPTVSCHLPPGQNSDILHRVAPMSVQYPIHAHAADADVMKNRSISIGHAPSDWQGGYYHYNTAPQQHYVSRPSLAGDTYLPPHTGYNQQHTYHGPLARSFPVEQSQQQQQQHMNAHCHHHVHVHPTTDLDKQQETSTVPVQVQDAKEAYRTQQIAPPGRSISTERHSPARALTIHDFPQAELLSQAFMQFMYSMSTIFRDPKYEPLVNSLDQQFGHRVVTTEVPHSAPPTIPTDETEREHSVARCNTHSILPRHSEEKDSELNSIMKK